MQGSMSGRRQMEGNAVLPASLFSFCPGHWFMMPVVTEGSGPVVP